MECIIDQEEDVLPMLLGGQQLNQMHPFNDEILLKYKINSYEKNHENLVFVTGASRG